MVTGWGQPTHMRRERMGARGRHGAASALRAEQHHKYAVSETELVESTRGVAEDEH